MQNSSAEDVELARRATESDGEAFGLLFERWFDRAFDVAWHVVHDRDTAADVTQEAFASAWQQIGSLRQPESFGGWLLRIARNKALNRLQRERRSRPVGDEETLVTLDPRRSDDPTDAMARGEHGDLVWAASAALGEDDASMLSLHLRHGLDAPELAEELGVKPNAAHQRLFRLKKRLADAIGAWVLWHQGAPSCPALRLVLDDAGLTRFDGTTSKTIAAHAQRCSDCDASRELRLSPEALFGAMPLVVADPALRANVVAALDGLGVPARVAGAADAPSTAPDAPSQTTTGATSEPQASDTDLGHAPTTETEAPTTQPTTEATSDTQASEVAIDTRPSEATSDTQASEAAIEPGDEPGASAYRARRAKVGVGIGAVVALAVGGGLALWMLGGGTDDSGTIRTAADADLVVPTTTATTDAPTTTDSTMTTESPTTTGDAGVADDDGPGVSGPPETQAPAPPTDPDPATGTTRPDTTEPTEPSAPPVIGGFRATPGGRACSPQETPTTFAWSSTGATSATLGPRGGQTTSVSTDGTAQECSPPGATWVLTVTGPGGSVSAQAAAPSQALTAPAGD